MLAGEHLGVSSIESGLAASDADRVARLESELSEASERQTATSQVLEVIGHSVLQGSSASSRRWYVTP